MTPRVYHQNDTEFVRRKDWLVPKDSKAARRPTKAEQRAATMEQILDAAEYLFSKHGLYGVTLKDVAKRVEVHHTLLNYYFKDKKSFSMPCLRVAP